MEQNDMVSSPITPEAAYLLTQTRLVRRVPADVRAEIDAVLARGPRERPPIDVVWREMALRQKFGVSRPMLRAYAQQLRAAHAQFACSEVVKALAVLMEMPAGQSADLQDRSEILLLGKIAQALNKSEEIPPDQLLKLADALAKQRTAVVRTKAQTLAEQKVRRAARSSASKEGFNEAEFQERIRRIYGITSKPACPPREPASGQGVSPRPEPTDDRAGQEA